MTLVGPIDRQLATYLSEQVEKVLQPLADELGVRIQRARGVFEPYKLTMKLEIMLPGAERAEFERECAFFGVPKEVWGRLLTYKGKTYQVVGLMPRRQKPLVLRQTLTDKRYLFAIEVLKACGVMCTPVTAVGDRR
jgi:hypothetical protein